VRLFFYIRENFDCMRVFSLIIALFLLIYNTESKAGPRLLSENAEISLLTCSPGKELYSVFGHSAIRVNDPASEMDWVFNYGTFDFDTPNFYLKFSSGQLNYILSVNHFSRFVQSYFREERSVYEQVLNLTASEKQNLFNALVENAKPENKFYRYDFFFDNCATRIRDMIINHLDGQIHFQDTTVSDQSFRDYIHEYVNQKPWTSDGLDLLLGVRTDNIASVRQQMFLPDYMMLYFGKATISKDNTPRGLVKEMHQLLKFDNEISDIRGITPDQLFWALLIISVILFLYEIKRKKKPFMLVTRLLLCASGCIGVLFFYLWFLSLHSVTGQNFNLLWAMPTNLILAFLPLKILSQRFFRILQIVTLSLLIINVLTLFFIPQYIPTFVLPFSLILIMRFTHLVTFTTKNIKYRV